MLPEVTSIKTLSELDPYVETVKALLEASGLSTATVLTLSGDLGAGKTTFMQHLGRAYGITDTMPSPTFGIMKLYPLGTGRFTTLVHMDAYRIDDVSELGPLRFSELLNNPEILLCIEWAERIAAALPRERLDLTLQSQRDGQRTILLKNSLS